MNRDILKQEWYVLHTRSRFENVVSDGLLKKSFDVFLPKAQVPSKRKDRKLMIWVPVFPGYLFVKTDLSAYEHLDILKTVGIVRFVGTKSGPVSVPDETIDSLKIMVNSDNPITTGRHLTRGDRVMVVRGPFPASLELFLTIGEKAGLPSMWRPWDRPPAWMSRRTTSNRCRKYWHNYLTFYQFIINTLYNIS